MFAFWTSILSSYAAYVCRTTLERHIPRGVPVRHCDRYIIGIKHYDPPRCHEDKVRGWVSRGQDRPANISLQQWVSNSSTTHCWQDGLWKCSRGVGATPDLLIQPVCRGTWPAAFLTRSWVTMIKRLVQGPRFFRNCSKTPRKAVLLTHVNIF